MRSTRPPSSEPLNPTGVNRYQTRGSTREQIRPVAERTDTNTTGQGLNAALRTANPHKVLFVSIVAPCQYFFFCANLHAIKRKSIQTNIFIEDEIQLIKKGVDELKYHLFHKKEFLFFTWPQSKCHQKKVVAPIPGKEFF